MAFPKSFLLLILSFSLSSTVLASPHAHNNFHHHRAVAARAPISVPVHADIASPIVKRGPKRCKARPSSSSQAAAPTLPAANIATDDDKPSPTPEKQSPSPTPEKEAAPTTTPKPSPTPQAAPPPPPAPPAPSPNKSSNQPNFLSGTQTGQGTFYATGLGSCGITNNDGQFIAAVSHLLYDSYPGYDGGNPNNNPLCKRMITASYQGKSVTVMVTDRCEACAMTDLDFSPAAFNTIADPSVGRISGMTWHWAD